MRGLTPLERAKLAHKVAGGGVELLPPDHAEVSVLRQLVASGRLWRRLEPDSGSPTGTCWCTYPTDLGRLALRVCPVDEF